MAHEHHHDHAHGADGRTAVDPVCGMRVDPLATAHHAEHAGQAFHFCSAGCRAKFATEPDRFLAKDQTPARPALAGTIYTCPMHPKIRRDAPGA